MKPLNPLRLGMTFAGCFLGAGYVSGQELLQFFGVFGARGWMGLMVALLLICAAGLSLLKLAFTHAGQTPDQLILGRKAPALRGLLTALQLLFLFSVTSVMTAGAGALMEQLAGLKPWLGALGFTVLLFYAAIHGLENIISIFSLSVPLLTVTSTVCSLLAHFILAPDAAMDAAVNPLIGGWLTGSVTFASYNLFSAIGILTLLGRRTSEKPILFKGTLLGILLLFLIAASVLCSLNAYPQIRAAQLPMLALTGAIHPYLAYLYGALLLASMFGTALSCTTALIEQLRWYFPSLGGRRKMLSALLLTAAFTGSLAGFSSLVGTAYPLFGYCSSIVLLCLLWRLAGPPLRALLNRLFAARRCS